jgi:hypothetical protein
VENLTFKIEAKNKYLNHKKENDDLSNITTSGPFFNQVAHYLSRE